MGGFEKLLNLYISSRFYTERQRREAQERKDQEKRKQLEIDQQMSSHWAEQVTSPRAKSVAQPQQVKPVTTVDDSVINQTAQGVRDVELSPQRHHSAEASPSKGKQGEEEDTK